MSRLGSPEVATRATESRKGPPKPSPIPTTPASSRCLRPRGAGKCTRPGYLGKISSAPKKKGISKAADSDESEPWNDSDQRLYQLQERFNAYVSFLLDGEFAEWDPKLARKRARIELRCAHMPGPRAIELVGQIRDQLAHQEIDVQVIVKETG